MKNKNIFLTAILLMLLAFTCIPAQADDVIIPASGGNFQVKEFIVKSSYGHSVDLTITIVNNTDRIWREPTFLLNLYDTAGQLIKPVDTVLLTAELYSLNPGEEGEIFKHVIIPKNQQMAKCLISFFSGTYDVDYTFSMVKPVKSTNLSYEDNFIKIVFDPEPARFEFSLENKTDEPIKLDWNQVSYIDSTQKAHKVYNMSARDDKNKVLIPTLIPPTTKIGDLIFASDLNQLLPEGDDAMAYKGKNVGIFMPLEINGKVKNYFFTFEISDVKVTEYKK